MKKILIVLLVALSFNLSMNAQDIMIMRGNTAVDIYSASEYDEIVFEDVNFPITGTAKANIGGKQVNVPWIQLWENGPKFAMYNLGVTDGNTASYGGYYSCDNSEITSTWGSNWRLPTSDELHDLFEKCFHELGNGEFCCFAKGDAMPKNYLSFPLAGYLNDGVVNDGNVGGYWTSDGKTLDVCVGVQRVWEGSYSAKQSIRPVLVE